MQDDNCKDENIKRLKDLVAKLLNSKYMLDDFIEEVFNKDVFFYDFNTNVGVDTLIKDSRIAKRLIFNELFHEYDDDHTCIVRSKEEHEENQKIERLKEIKHLENSIKAMTETLSQLKAKTLENKEER